ncbi:MAG TPA: MerR family transcriptional regulator [Solirubrobacteraceae bacterium]|nr:MerR family transcriptional regulator [Solirubrobacteraceae bacterium]
MSATVPGTLRIGDVARLVGTTPRTIRYYEEIGLLPAAGERASGQHRVYGEDEVERLREALRLKSLLGLSLEELREVLEAEEARAARQEEFWREGVSARRKREILEQGLAHAERQLELVRRRRDDLEGLAREIEERRDRIMRRFDEL